MEDELILKEKYNDLLKSFKEGTQYLAEHPEEEKKVQKRLDEISKEISNIMDAIPNMTEDEKVNGFKIENKVEVIDTKEQSKNQIAVQKQENNSLESFSDDWKIATQLAKSTLFPTEFQGHPENIIVALGMAKKMDMDVFTISQNLHLIKGRLSWSGSF